MSSRMSGGPDTLDKTVAFLAKRDGIDKTLKIMRYASKLALATSLVSNDTVAGKLCNFEASIGASRKAFRLGKFLQNVNAIRRLPLRTPHITLELLANVGECTYYFISQFQWLVQAGVLPPTIAPRITRFSAGGEMVGYIASIILAIFRLHFLLEREVALIAELQRRRRARAADGTSSGADESKDEALVFEIKQTRARRALRTLGLAQDIADSLLALEDLRSPGKPKTILSSKSLLATAGLVSGCLSAYKNWPGTVK